MKVLDPVCDMTIEQEEAVATSTYEGKLYYFCSQSCKESFDRSPGEFLSKYAHSQERTGAEHAATDPVCVSGTMIVSIATMGRP